MRRSSRILAVALVLGALGCGGGVERLDQVDISRLPGPVSQSARRAMPGFTLTSAYKIKHKEKDGFEVRGKDKDGKVTQVYLTPDGTVLKTETE